MEVICDLKKTAHGIAISVTSNWCKQAGKNQADANVLHEFMDGLPLYEDDLGELCLSGDVAYR